MSPILRPALGLLAFCVLAETAQQLSFKRGAAAAGGAGDWVTGVLRQPLIWAGIALNYTYSNGTRVGFVQKFSRKGWLCKTYEGELAQVNLPGALSQIFVFSVRDDSVAHAIERAMASSTGRVELTYRHHVGGPTRCFGETEYFVDGVKAIADGN